MEGYFSRLLGSYETGAMTRRELIQTLTMIGAAATRAGAAPAEAAPFLAVGVHHIAVTVGDPARSRDFYRDLLGMKVKRDEATTVHVDFGISRLVLHKGGDPGHISHFAVMLDKWNKDAVQAELKRRGFDPRPDGESWHIKDPDGMDLQISSRDLGGAPSGV